ncbi:MAG TPA: SufE family protein [Brevundimonas sp.]|jgi:cysteine desulfuration protein SufE|uniref:SufE family protein n=1 Tax=Brevundimonas sp. TaxID=1871086 RepID=UPI002B9969C3|nr:SufE family protein [Brevundimonas sp.]HRH21547.1 SufE family protein [Brevundimonas sp.]
MPGATALDDLAETFDLLGDWEERYRYVIELGQALAPLADAERNPDTKVSGCASQVWLVHDPVRDGTLHWRGDSDAHIVRGLIAIVLDLYNGLTSDQVRDFDAQGAITRLGLSEALSSQRANGLASMIARLRADAAQTIR